MKKLFFLLALAAIVASCKTDEPQVKKFQLDPNAMIRIEPVAGTRLKVKSAAETQYLTALEIVQQASDISFYSIPLEQLTGSAFGENQRDVLSETPALLMPAFKIIEPSDTSLVPYFIDCRDLIVRKLTNPDKPNMIIDTIAYIPNDSLSVASAKIKAAWEKKDHETIYKLFKNLYKFKPITGAEYRELKRQNLQ